MLHNFPDAYPEELFYSMCARYAETMLFLNKEKAGQYLFSRKNPRPVIDFPSNLEVFTDNLAANHIIDVDMIIDNHSLLPYYTPFLEPSRVQDAREGMRYGNNNGLHTIIGNANSKSNNIETLYYCAHCANENRNLYGEAYWHRVHQLPDVYICPKHSIWLTPYYEYNLYTRVYSLADDVIPKNSDIKPLDFSDDGNLLLLHIAEQSLWLLQNPHIVTTSQFLRRQYAIAFHNMGLASYKGSIQSNKVLMAFRNKYSQGILSRLGCSLHQSVNKNWLTGRLLRDDRHSYPTIRHLLVLHFLDISIEDFVSYELQFYPFGNQKYPCLNLICDHYKAFIISDIRIDEDVYGDPQGYFKCPTCGFEYKRHGPDFAVHTWKKAMKITSYGHVWEDGLRCLIEADVSINKIAKILQAGKNTIKQQIDKLNLLMPKNSKAEPIQYAPYKAQVNPQRLGVMKQNWIESQAEDPELDFIELRKLCEHEYYYISIWDKLWLDDNSPEHRLRGSASNDWEKLDAKYVVKIPSIVEYIISLNPLKRVTVSRISLQMGLRYTYITRHKNKLTDTYQLATEYSETTVDFAIRKLWYARDYFIDQKEIPTQTQLVRKASIRRLRTDKQVESTIDLILNEFT